MTGAVPELRFPEFQGEWERKALGDFMTFKNGVNAGKEQYGSGAKFINVLDIIAAGPIFYDRIIGRVELSERELEKNDVQYGDILFQRSSETREEVGQSNIYLDPEKVATFGGFVIRGRPVQDLDPRFFDGLLRTDAVRQDMTNRSGGSTRFNIGQESLARVAVTVPYDIAEQQKIADFLGTADAKLDAQRWRKSGLEAFKSGLMQRLFSQELRFTRDDGSEFPEWERVHLGRVFRERSERGRQDIELLSVTMDRGVVKASDIGREDGASADTGNYKFVAVNDIAYNSMRMWQGASGLSKYDGIVSPAYTVISPVADQVPLYWGYRFKAQDLIFKFRQFSQGLTSDTWNLKYPALSAIPIEVPHPDEQRKIAAALSAMDAKIAAVADQINHMETFKKGLLQQMFV